MLDNRILEKNPLAFERIRGNTAAIQKLRDVEQKLVDMENTKKAMKAIPSYYKDRFNKK